MNRTKPRRHPVLRLIIAGLLLPTPAIAQEAALKDALREGGRVLYIRHAQTESDYADQVAADPLNCATQRVLSRAGWAQAKAIGDGIRATGADVAEVISSQYCRAWQTADLAFGETREEAALNFEPAEDYTDAQIAAMRDRVTPLIAAPVEAGKLRVIVGHDDPFEAVTGIYPEPQGVAYLLRVDGGRIEIEGMIPPDAWDED